MQLIESISLALSAIKANRMRSLLTMLGIIIGISSVITISNIGSSATSFIETELKGSGLELMAIYPNWQELGDYISDQYLITKDEAEALKDRFDEVVYYAPYSTVSGKANRGRLEYKIYLRGVGPDFLKCESDYKLTKGRFLTDKDLKNTANVIVISEDAAKYFFGNADPIGKELQITVDGEVRDFKVVGVYSEKTSKLESLMGGVQTYTFFTPYSVNSGNDFYEMEVMFYLDAEDVSKVADEMVNYLAKIKRVGPESFVQDSAQSTMQQINSIMNVLSLSVAAIAAISLIVGGIGIMNIMLVSVTERTREIGTRKALGAMTRDIMNQFLIEAIILSCIGGIIGILLGIGVSGLAALILDTKLVLSGISIIVSVVFSILVGLIFGLVPARKAAKMDPIQALSYE